MVPVVHRDDLGLNQCWMRRADRGTTGAEALHAAEGISLLKVEEAFLALVTTAWLHVGLAETF